MSKSENALNKEGPTQLTDHAPKNLKTEIPIPSCTPTQETHHDPSRQVGLPHTPGKKSGQEDTATTHKKPEAKPTGANTGLTQEQALAVIRKAQKGDLF